MESNSPWKPMFGSVSEMVVMVEDTWEIDDADGGGKAKIVIGAPVAFKTPEGRELYACGFFVEKLMPGIETAVGLGPLNALVSACVAIRRLFRYP